MRPKLLQMLGGKAAGQPVSVDVGGDWSIALVNLGIGMPEGIPELLSPIPYVVPAQLFAAKLAETGDAITSLLHETVSGTLAIDDLDAVAGLRLDLLAHVGRDLASVR